MTAMSRCDYITPTLLHTGQHYDGPMSEQFFADLAIRPPDINLGVGSGSHAVQTAEVMRGVEPVLERLRPDMVLVVGDVNSTLAATITAVKMSIPVAHVEAGLRSFDRSMPEEINRILTDAVADLLFVTEESACRNLAAEGVAPERVHFVGNVMIDSLEAMRPVWSRTAIQERIGLGDHDPYAVLTLHRPANVDDPAVLAGFIRAVEDIAERMPVIFPVHPRVKARLYGRADAGTTGRRRDGYLTGVIYTDPLGYLDFVGLLSRAQLVLTDSGGIQEETTVLGVPCLTLRDNTERPVTVTHGTNQIVGTDPTRIAAAACEALERPPAASIRPPLWDGHAADRIVAILVEWWSETSPL
jgi:UDP-N-acetylglucosamine 2-epimerase (non-hydrolysing)